MCVPPEAIQELLAAVLIWYEDNMHRAFQTKKNAPQLNVLDRRGSTGFEAWGFSVWGGILQHVGGQYCF